LAVAVAVARSEAPALLELRRPCAAAGAVGALVQLEPQIGVGGVSWHQCASDRLAIDADTPQKLISSNRFNIEQEHSRLSALGCISPDGFNVIHTAYHWLPICLVNRVAYNPWLPSSCACVPVSATLPPSIATIWWASKMVLSLCAITSVVRPWNRRNK
jgi:hypothetical protein